MSSAFRKTLFTKSKRILIKLGTSVVTQSDGSIALSRVANIVEQIVYLIENGKEVIIVTSGAVGMGKQKLLRQAYLSTPLRKHVSNLAPSEMNNPRACAAAGQSKLMTFYDLMFSQKHIECSQILLTDEDFSSPERRQNFRSSIETLIGYSVVPILNENDVISTRKTPLRDNTNLIFWDNDSLSALICQELAVDICILLSDVEGLYTGPPDSENSKLISLYTPEVVNITIGEKSRVGRGGMQAKIEASLNAVKNGVKAVVITSGYRPNSIIEVMKGENVGTLIVENAHLYAREDASSRMRAEAVREASRKLLQLKSEERVKILHLLARRLLEAKEDILRANARDIAAAQASKLNPSLAARLPIGSKLETLAKGIESLADSQEPIGRVLRFTEVSEGLELQQISVPIGVLLVIFESRPDALPQIASLAIRSGNGLLLKGGKESLHTNRVLHKIVTDAIFEGSGSKVPRDLVCLVETHQDINEFLKLDEHIDLVIPRGSGSLIRYVQNNTKIPVLGHAEGICHIYIDDKATLESTLLILIDAKTDYPAACNSVETILIHKNLLQDGRIHAIISTLEKSKVKIYGGPKACQHLQLESAPSLHYEYSDLKVTLEIVEDVVEAVRHINTYGSSHTEAIVTEDPQTAALFLRDVDSACVFHNCSTRFADGFRFGLGAEVGISTSRIHARGPVGIDGLLTTKWILKSKSSHIVHDFSEGSKKYSLRPLPIHARL